MSGRYIDADALRHRVLYWSDSKNLQGNHEQTKAFNYCLCMIDDAPTADVVERKRGEWLFGKQIDGAYDVYGIKSGSILLRCSKCNFAHAFIDGHSSQYHFCPNCGAKMDEREEEE